MYLGNGLETSCEIERCLESYSCNADAFKTVARPHKRPSVLERDFWPGITPVSPSLGDKRKGDRNAGSTDTFQGDMANYNNNYRCLSKTDTS